MEEKINLLYNFLYNDSYKECFELDKIVPGKIKIDDIKITNENDSMSHLKELIDSKLQFMTYNENENIIYLKRFSDSFPTTIKISFYIDDSNNLNNFPNNDALFSYLLSTLVLSKKTRNILLPIVNFDIPFDKIEPLLKNIPVYKKIKEKIEYNEVKDLLSVRVREHFLQSKILKEYFEQNICDYKPLLFQIIHTLAVIQKEFPGFRHNNLTIDNVIIYIEKNDNHKVYEFGSKKWSIINNNFDIKISNFEKATLPKIYGVKNQRDTDVPYINEVNDYFDLHSFLNSLLENIKNKSNSKCNLETTNFLNKIIPIQLRGMKDKKFYLTKNEKLFKPSELLSDSYFNEYKEKKSKDKELMQNTVEIKDVLSENNLKITETNDTEDIIDTPLKADSDVEQINIELKDQEDESEEKIEKNQQEENYKGRQTKKESKKSKKESKKSKKESKKSTKDSKKTHILKGGANDSNSSENNASNQTTEENQPKVPIWDPAHPKYNPNHKPKSSLPPWDPAHPNYKPRNKPWEKPKEESDNTNDTSSADSSEEKKVDKREIKKEDIPSDFETETPKKTYEPKKPFDPSKSRPPFDPSKSRPAFDSSKPEPKPEPYVPDVKPWDKREPEIGARKPFVPRNDINPLRTTDLKPDENFQPVRNYDMMNPTPAPPAYIPLFDPEGGIISKLLPFVNGGNPANFPLNKIYNITLGDPLGNHVLVNRIYEDVLPGEKTIYTFISLKEREAIKRSVRNSILNKYDGEDFTIQGGSNSLLSWIKIYDLNPYSIKTNPYDDIPLDFLLYRSAYPIKYNENENSLKSTPTSIGINIRVYFLSLGAARYSNFETPIEKFYFDVWRDLEYYIWVDSIIKRKISPNFINMLLYIYDTKSEINYKELEGIKQRKDTEKYKIQKNNNDLINKLYPTTRESIPDYNGPERDRAFSTYLHSRIPRSKDETTAKTINFDEIKVDSKELNVDITKEMIEDLTTYDRKKLVILTEAPNMNIIKWNSKVYDKRGAVYKMLSNGYHSLEVWRSILFQMVYAFVILQKNNILFNNFTLENNVYIKEVQSDNTGNNCWLYKVNNIDYYVPNYGYLLALDSKYADLVKDEREIQFKIYGDIYKGINGIHVSMKFSNEIKNILISFMDPNNYKVGEKPNELESDVISLMEKIKNNLGKNDSIDQILPTCFPELFNNKVGKLVTKLEKENFSILNRPEYREGNLMIRQKRYDEYDWVVYKGLSIDKKKRIILTKEGEKEVFPSSLFSYPETIKPDEINVIDTYIF